MKLLKLITMVLAIVIAQACKTAEVNEHNFKTQLSVYQNNKNRPVKKLSKTIKLDKKPFSLRFYNKKYDPENKKFYTAQIAAFIEKSEFDKVKVGLAKNKLPCFSPGSGIAANKSGKYEFLYFNNEGHHYAYYKNSESKRLRLLKNFGNLLQLEFDINSMAYNNKKVKINQTNLKEFYLAFFIDKNLNGIIEKGELNKLTIKI